LGTLPFIGSDEPRYAQVAEEMYESGDYITPTLERRPWLEKPPLIFWMESGSFKLFGISEWSARIPNAMVTSLLALLVGLFARSLWGSRCGMLAFLVFTTSLFVVAYGRVGTTDLPFTAGFTLSLVTAFLALKTSRRGCTAVSGAALGFAVLAKGPLAILLWCGCLLVYLVWTGKAVKVRQLFLATATLLLVAGPWFWLVWQANGENFVLTFIANHHLARFVSDLHHHGQPFWYYVPVLLGGYFPWIPFLGASVRRLWQERDKQLVARYDEEIFLWTCALVPFLFFSISTSKLPGYVLPVVPPLSLLVAREWDRILESGKWSREMRIGLLGYLGLGSLFALGIGLGFWKFFGAPVAGFVLGSVIVAGVLLTWWTYSRRDPRDVFLTLVGSVTVSFALIHLLGAPIIGPFESTKELCLTSEPRISPAEPLLQYRFHHYTTHYYARGQVRHAPIGEPTELAKYVERKVQDTYVLLTTEHGWSELQRLAGSSLLQRAGRLYLVQIIGGTDLAERIRRLEQTDRIRDVT
jgi:4-amino-4-deoxy-L-arabinose transferase-like glycosyltransferase